MANDNIYKAIHILTSPEGFARYTENNHAGYVSQVRSAVSSPVRSRTASIPIRAIHAGDFNHLQDTHPVHSYVLVDTVLGINGDAGNLESALLELDPSNLIILHTPKQKIDDYLSIAQTTGGVVQVKRAIYNPNDLAIIYGGSTPKESLPSVGEPFVFSAVDMKPDQHKELSTSNHAPVILGYLGGFNQKRVR